MLLSFEFTETEASILTASSEKIGAVSYPFLEGEKNRVGFIHTGFPEVFRPHHRSCYTSYHRIKFGDHYLYVLVKYTLDNLNIRGE